MIITRETKLCISLASKPSNFGVTIHNFLYEAMGLDFIYKACSTSNLEGAINGVRALNIRGCSISMPYKETVIDLLDEVEEVAHSIGAVNTVVNESGTLKGYNTDVTGAIEALKLLNIDKKESVLVLGAGGAAKAILYALKINGSDQVAVANRDSSRLKNLQGITDFEPVNWDQRNNFPADVIINATSIGMNPKAKDMPVEKDIISNCRAVMDVIVSPIESSLISFADSMEKQVAHGYIMSMEQARAQFKLYTGVEVPNSLIREKIVALLKDL